MLITTTVLLCVPSKILATRKFRAIGHCISILTGHILVHQVMQILFYVLLLGISNRLASNNNHQPFPAPVLKFNETARNKINPNGAKEVSMS